MVYNFGWICMPKFDLLVIFAEFFSQTFLIDLCDRCYCHIILTTIGCYWQMLLPVGCCWLMLLAIVADVKATVFFVCGHPQLIVVADVMATL